MKIDAPFYSQWLDVSDPDWQRRSCGIASLKMAMLAIRSPACQLAGRFSEEEDISLDILIKRGVELGAYKPGIGWIHDGLVALAKEYGFAKSFRKEWPIVGSSTSNNEGLVLIEEFLRIDTPVIASIKSDGGPARNATHNVAGGGHLILLTGFEKEGEKILGFYCNDPDAKSIESGKNKYLQISDFLELWRGRIIVIAK